MECFDHLVSNLFAEGYKHIESKPLIHFEYAFWENEIFELLSVPRFYETTARKYVRTREFRVEPDKSV